MKTAHLAFKDTKWSQFQKNNYFYLGGLINQGSAETINES